LQNTVKLIIDLTETPSGGNSAVARAIMGRFISKEMPYQKHEAFETRYKIRRSWIEYVSPLKSTYSKEVYILVGHWTGSMGEGIAIGFDGIGKAKIIGTKMAGLLGAIEGFKLSQTNIGFQIPTERLYHINGTPREKFIPKYLCGNIYNSWEKVNELIKMNE
jgi:carboxyl-terminal processing protease